ncbi:MAG: arabinosyltransferase domain-containing protein [Pseudonocardiaceae bacterium]
MLTSERAGASRPTAAVRGANPERGRGDRFAPRRLRVAATVLGLLGALLAVVVPLLPVVQETVAISWPRGGDITAVNTPLTAYQPQELTATVPCATARSLDVRSEDPAAVLSTTPPGATDGSAVGMRLQVADGTVTVSSRGQVLGAAVLPPGPCAIVVRSATAGTTVTLDGTLTGGDPGETRVIDVTEDVRPQVVGVYSDLDQTIDPVEGLGVQITPDTRFQSTAHPLKLTAIAAAVLAVGAALVLLHRLDRRVGRRAPRLVPSGWWRPTGRDVTVISVLAVWVVIGGLTSDDGYILTMIRTRAEMGYIGNYYRWFNVPEAPFGWPYELYALWSQISTAPPWLRLPSLLMGVVSWLLISREVMPRLGREVRRSRAAGWAAAAVFLAFWLPYNNGLRLEPLVAVGSLLVLCAVERAVATRRVAPLALGLLVAAFTVAASPTGFIAIAPFLVAMRPTLQVLRRHAGESGWPAVLAPILGAGLLVLVVIFADQTLQGVLEATRIRANIGPNLSWFEEPARYALLFSQLPDGSLTRRFPVLLLFLCLGTCLAVLLRRGSIPGAGVGSSRRLIGTVGVSLFVIALTPTKWTHHFGAFASVGAALGALTALATSASVLRSVRNRWWFLAGLLAILALASTGLNAPWYVSQFGVPWFDKPPSFHGFQASTALITAAVAAAVIAVVAGLRTEPGAPPPPRERTDRHRRALRIGSAPLAVICGLLVLAEVGAMVKAIHKQRDSYSLGAANITHLTGSTCNLSDAVLVEQDRSQGALVALDTTRAEEIPLRSGFVRERLPASATDPPESPEETTEKTPESDEGNADTDEENPVGSLPRGLGGERIPVLSSYAPQSSGTGQVRTAWFGLPDWARAGLAPVVVTVAGELGLTTPLVAQFGRQTPNGIEVVEEIPVDGVPTAAPPGWRDYRLNIASGATAEADTVRLLGTDADVTADGWLAFSMPRVPELVPMTAVVGQDTPVFMDWPVGLVHPCLRPFAVTNGIAELPEYRLLPDDMLAPQSEGWSSAGGGGPVGWLGIVATERELPTYLEGAWNTDWGKLTVIEPRVSGTGPATVRTDTEVRSGWWSPGPLISTGERAEVKPLGR